jgi:hypothetical protein
MTEQEQNIAIAEACGWTRRNDLDYVTGKDSTFHQVWERGGRTCDQETMPNYTTDLNAMHEALMTLQEDDQVEFCLRLTEVVRRGKPVGTGLRQWDQNNATPAQRAEAFLKSIGKWKDQP